MFDIIKVCPYCGNEYGGRIGCCGESENHGEYIITDDPDEDAMYPTYMDAAEEADRLWNEHLTRSSNNGV